MSGDVVVIGVGNPYRRDDGVGPAVAAACARRNLPGVTVITELADPAALLDAWTGATLAVLIDAAVCGTGPPGRVRCSRVTDFARVATVGTHGMDIAAVIRLGQTLGRAPGNIAIVSVEVADIGHGPGLTPAVEAAVPAAVELVLAAISSCPAPIPAPRTRSR